MQERGELPQSLGETSLLNRDTKEEKNGRKAAPPEKLGKGRGARGGEWRKNAQKEKSSGREPISQKVKREKDSSREKWRRRKPGKEEEAKRNFHSGGKSLKQDRDGLSRSKKTNKGHNLPGEDLLVDELVRES